jgi:hypothetical protein
MLLMRQPNNHIRRFFFLLCIAKFISTSSPFWRCPSQCIDRAERDTVLIKCGCSGHWSGGYDNKQRKKSHAQKRENTVDERGGDDVIDTYIFFFWFYCLFFRYHTPWQQHRAGERNRTFWYLTSSRVEPLRYPRRLTHVESVYMRKIRTLKYASDEPKWDRFKAITSQIM